MCTIEDEKFPFIRFTNWKQGGERPPSLSKHHSFHSYASRIGSKPALNCLKMKSSLCVSIHTLHELEARRMKDAKDAEENPCFHSYASRIGSKKPVVDVYVSPGSADVSIHTLHELEARIIFHSLMVISQSRVSIHTLHELEARFLVFNTPAYGYSRFHSYASRIGSKSVAQVGTFPVCQQVSIHTLHELEARLALQS